MRNKNWLIIFISVISLSCETEFEAPVPNDNWDEFNSSETYSVGDALGSRLNGVYTVSDGSSVFGGSVALKWIWTIENSDTVYTLSGFFAKDNTYFIASVRQTDSVVLINGYYRKMISTETGAIRLKINYESGAGNLFDGNSIIGLNDILITGTFGDLSESMDSIKFSFLKPLRNDSGFLILAHRCGGRTSDLLPSAENSVNMVLLSTKLGATGIELDVRMTSDNVPIVYHDETLNDRLIQPNGMMGNISNYSFQQLRDLVRLSDGQTIPSLREILEAVLMQTSLRFVWLDLKYEGDLEPIHILQQEYLLKARQLNRDLVILLGIPDDDVQRNFSDLNNFQSIPSLNERYDEVANVNSVAWGAPWSLGVMKTEIESLHLQNKIAIAWTMDTQDFIEQYISENLYDGILSNYPCTVAYCFYSSQ